MVLSRAFTVDGVPRLLPFVDMLNHHPDAGKITINAEENPPAMQQNLNNVINQDEHAEGQHTRKRPSLSKARGRPDAVPDRYKPSEAVDEVSAQSGCPSS